MGDVIGMAVAQKVALGLDIDPRINRKTEPTGEEKLSKAC